MKKINKKLLLVATFIVFFILIQFYPLVESTQALSATDNVIVTLNVDSAITISNGPDVTMAPHITVGTNSSIGSSAWTVITNNALGYTLNLLASTAPALVSGSNSFADYPESVSGTPDYGSGSAGAGWAATASTYQFAYSAYGTDTNTTTWGTGLSCGSAGAPAANQKYVSTKTTNKIIATRAVVTPVAGIATNICFVAQQNGVFAPAGTYTATITGTAITL